jgi:hypothetical protein
MKTVAYCATIIVAVRSLIFTLHVSSDVASKVFHFASPSCHITAFSIDDAPIESKENYISGLAGV